MKKYQLNNQVELTLNGNELYFVDKESGFVGKGNKNAYDILSCFVSPITEKEAIEELTQIYGEKHYPRIKKSVPHIVEWALERKIMSEV